MNKSQFRTICEWESRCASARVPFNCYSIYANGMRGTVEISETLKVYLEKRVNIIDQNRRLGVHKKRQNEYKFFTKKNFTNTHTTSQSSLKCAHMHRNPMKQVDLFSHSKVFHRALAIIVIINDNCTKCHFTYYTLFTLVCAVFSIVCPYKTHI